MSCDKETLKKVERAQKAISKLENKVLLCREDIDALTWAVLEVIHHRIISNEPLSEEEIEYGKKLSERLSNK